MKVDNGVKLNKHPELEDEEQEKLWELVVSEIVYAGSKEVPFSLSLSSSSFLSLSLSARTPRFLEEIVR